MFISEGEGIKKKVFARHSSFIFFHINDSLLTRAPHHFRGWWEGIPASDDIIGTVYPIHWESSPKPSNSRSLTVCQNVHVCVCVCICIYFTFIYLFHYYIQLFYPFKGQQFPAFGFHLPLMLQGAYWIYCQSWLNQNMCDWNATLLLAYFFP